VLGFIAERKTSFSVKALVAGQVNFGFDECEVSSGGVKRRLRSGWAYHCFHRATGTATRCPQRSTVPGRAGDLSAEVHRVDDFPHGYRTIVGRGSGFKKSANPHPSIEL
jgi:hypothetical protein